MAEEGGVPSHYSQSSPSHASEILEQLNVQRYYGAFCDIVLRVEDVDVRLHKCVLAASSARLQSMVYGMRQECGELLTLKDVSLPGFWPILDYIYTGVLKLENGSVQEVLLAAQMLEIHDVEKICLDYVKLFQTTGSSSSSTSGTTPASPSDVKAQTMRRDMNLVPMTTSLENRMEDVAPPVLVISSSSGHAPGQYITPVSPAQPHGDRAEKLRGRAASVAHNPNTPGGMNPGTPGGINPGTPGGINPGTPGGINPSTPGGNMARTPTPNHMPMTPTPTPIHGTPVSPSVPPPPPPLPLPPACQAPPHLGFPGLPMPPPPPHLPPPLPPLLPINSIAMTTTQPPIMSQTPISYQSAHPDSHYPTMHGATGNTHPRGFPGMPIDTNYVEDYLKLIESFQGEPQQLAHQVQQYQQQQQQHHQQMQHPQVSHRNNSIPNAPPLDGSRVQTIPSQEYISDTPSTPAYHPHSHNHIQHHHSNKNDMPVPVSNSSNDLRTNQVNNTANVPDNSRHRQFTNNRTTTNPIGHMSAEEVRRTVLTVLSKFDDDEEEDHNHKGKKSDKTEPVPPLTSFLNFGSLPETSKTTDERDDGDSLYGDLQIVSSDSDGSDQDNIDIGGNEVVNQQGTYDARAQNTDGVTQMDPNKKETLLMRIKQSAMQGEDSHQKGELHSHHQGEMNSHHQAEVIKVGNIEIKLPDFDNISSDVPAESSRPQLRNKPGGKSKKSKVNIPSREAIFKETVKDPSMSNRPLKKRIRLRMKKKYQCQKCGRDFVRADALESHLEQHDKRLLQSCHVCSQKFVRGSELTRHMREHTTEVFRCLQCESEFKNSKLYKQHMDTIHREEKAFYCTYGGCEYRNSKLSNLEKHMQIHGDMKRYHCQRCDKLFAQPNGLRSHHKSCLQERGYLCDFCGAKFNYLQSMKSHRLLHTGEKPNTCTECGARFTDPRNLKRHRRIHENTFPYKCDLCDKRFRHSNSLKAHANTHDRKPASLQVRATAKSRKLLNQDGSKNKIPKIEQYDSQAEVMDPRLTDSPAGVMDPEHHQKILYTIPVAPYNHIDTLRDAQQPHFVDLQNASPSTHTKIEQYDVSMDGNSGPHRRMEEFDRISRADRMQGVDSRPVTETGSGSVSDGVNSEPVVTGRRRIIHGFDLSGV